MVVSNSTINGTIYLFSSDGVFEEKNSPFPLNVDSFSVQNLAMSSSAIVLGLPEDNDSTGSAYIIQLEDTSLMTKLEAPDGEDGDIFGSIVAVSESFIAVTAPFFYK